MNWLDVLIETYKIVGKKIRFKMLSSFSMNSVKLDERFHLKFHWNSKISVETASLKIDHEVQFLSVDDKYSISYYRRT